MVVVPAPWIVTPSLGCGADGLGIRAGCDVNRARQARETLLEESVRDRRARCARVAARVGGVTTGSRYIPVVGLRAGGRRTVAAAPVRPSVMPPTSSARPDARRRNLRFINCSRLVMDGPAQPSVSAVRARFT